MDMLEGLMKNIKENNAKLHSLILKKVLDAHRNEVQCPQHPQSHSNPSRHCWKTKQKKTQRLQTALLDTNGAPLAMTKTAQIRLPQFDLLSPWAIYARNRRLCHHGATLIVKQLGLQIHSPSNHCVVIIHQVSARLGSK
jgi:hypothetical protein